MNILFAIVENNHQELSAYYKNNIPTYKELLLAFAQYQRATNEDNLETLMCVWNRYDKIFLDTSSRNDFYTVTWFKVGMIPEFLQKMQFHPQLRQFIADHHQDIYTEMMLVAQYQNVEYMQKNNLIKEILKTIEKSSSSKPWGVYKLYPNGFNISQLYENTDKDLLSNIDIDLHIQILLKCKHHQVSLEHSDDLFFHAKQIRQKFIDTSIKQTGYPPLLYSLHQDIADIIVKNHNHPIQHTNELWNNIERYNVDNIKMQKLPLIDVPFKNDSLYTGQKAKMALYIVSNNDELILGIDGKYGSFEQTNHHTALANGHNIKAGGIILFSDDMKDVIAINNANWHYTNISSCNLVKNKLMNSSFNIGNLEICDSKWIRINAKPTDLSQMRKMLKS